MNLVRSVVNPAIMAARCVWRPRFALTRHSTRLQLIIQLNEAISFMRARSEQDPPRPRVYRLHNDIYAKKLHVIRPISMAHIYG